MIFSILLALTGLTISAVAIYYSVIGLTAIFAAAFWPIVIMGTTLEAAKLVAASWLKAEWKRIPVLLKTYLTVAVLVLMTITSMGIFGFLSKAHTDQTLVSGDVQSKIALYDEKIKTERENIDAARRALKQMDDAVDQTMARSTSEQGAGRAAQLRRQQQAERTRLQKDITTAQSNISRLQAERAPIAAEVRKVEAEVGPIKYIAKLIYGDNPDANLLEKAVTWVIILIVGVFDPLAVLLLISAQMAWAWHKEKKKEEEEHPPYYVADVGEKPTEEEKADDLFPTYDEITPKEKQEPFIPPAVEELKEQEVVINEKTHPYLYKKWVGFGNLKPMVYKPEEPDTKITVDTTEVKVDETLPVEEGYQIFPELEEESKKKTVTYMIKNQGQQVKKTKDE